MFDPKLRKHPGQFVAQCALTTFVVFIVLLLLDAIANTAVIAALGASSFIAFTMPHHRVSRARLLLGGYAVGIVVGVACHNLSIWPTITELPVICDSSNIIFGALSVGISIFLMVICNFEHPPAAGVALGLAINQCNARTVLVVALGIVGLVTAKSLMRRLLLDLL